MALTVNPGPTEAASTGTLRYVFVYGTLRRGEQRDINLLRPTPLFIGEAQISGVLFDLGGYPGLRLGGGQIVHGEVYQIAITLEHRLDEIEEVWPQQTGEYTKQTVRVQLLGASALGLKPSCLVYEIAEKCAVGKPVIASGDWLKR